MNRTLKQSLWPAVLAAVLAVSAAAQQKPISQWTSLNGLQIGSEIRVALTSGRTVRGFVQSIGPDSLAINATTSQESLQRQDIKAVSLRRLGHRGRNALIGLAIGAGGGLATGVVLDKGTGRWFPNLGKEIFTPLGAIIGAVVGVAIPTGGWQVVYRAP